MTVAVDYYDEVGRGQGHTLCPAPSTVVYMYTMLIVVPKFAPAMLNGCHAHQIWE